MNYKIAKGINVKNMLSDREIIMTSWEFSR